MLCSCHAFFMWELNVCAFWYLQGSGASLSRRVGGTGGDCPLSFVPHPQVRTALAVIMGFLVCLSACLSLALNHVRGGWRCLAPYPSTGHSVHSQMRVE